MSFNPFIPSLLLPRERRLMDGILCALMVISSILILQKYYFPRDDATRATVSTAMAENAAP